MLSAKQRENLNSVQFPVMIEGKNKKFALVIRLEGESCTYSAYVKFNLKDNKDEYIEVNVVSPKASTPWEEVKKYYLFHAKTIYLECYNKSRKELAKEMKTNWRKKKKLMSK